VRSSACCHTGDGAGEHHGGSSYDKGGANERLALLASPCHAHLHLIFIVSPRALRHSFGVMPMSHLCACSHHCCFASSARAPFGLTWATAVTGGVRPGRAAGAHMPGTALAQRSQPNISLWA